MTGRVTYEPGPDGIARITLRRPEALNALDGAMTEQLWTALGDYHHDPDARVAVVTGEGRAFCVGADVKAAPTEARRLPTQDLSRLAEAVLGWDGAKPLVAAVQGHAVGAGLRLALLCDVVVCTDSASFRVPEVAHGLNAGWFWTVLASRAGDAWATEVTATARVWSGTEAAQRGIVTRSVPDGLLSTEVDELARTLAAMPPAALTALLETRRAELRRLDLHAWNTRDRTLSWRTPAGKADAPVGDPASNGR